MKELNTDNCPLCQRLVKLTFHHLIPKKVHGRNYFKKKYKRHDLQEGINICRKCHNGIHDLYDEMYLGKVLNTLELIQADPALAKHFAWVAKQRIATI